MLVDAVIGDENLADRYAHPDCIVRCPACRVPLTTALTVVDWECAECAHPLVEEQVFHVMNHFWLATHP